MIDVQGKWCLVTGASRGVGPHVARFMASQGVNVIVHSRSLAHTEAIVEEIFAAGVEAIAIEADLADPVSVEMALDEVLGAGLEVDILLNNAGIQVGYADPYWQADPEALLTNFRVNWIAPVIMAYRLLPGMLERGFGRIVNTTSGIRDSPEQAGYSASKAALDKVTYDIAARLGGTGVTINAVDPGWLRTDMGGPAAEGAPADALPGVVAPVFADDGVNGRFIRAQEFVGLALADAVARLNAQAHLQ